MKVAPDQDSLAELDSRGRELHDPGARGLALKLVSISGVLSLPIAVWASSRYGSNGLWWTISLTALARAVAMISWGSEDSARW